MSLTNIAHVRYFIYSINYLLSDIYSTFSIRA